MNKVVAFLGAGLLMLGMAGEANADITTFSNRTLFEAQGSIVVNSNFADYGLPNATPDIMPNNYSPYMPFTRGDVTYQYKTSIVGPGSGLTTTEPLLFTFWEPEPLVGSINTVPHYNMLGFDIALGVLASPPSEGTTATITVYTNTNAAGYSYHDLTIANAMNGVLEFKGFKTSSPGEYFTRFQIWSNDPWTSDPGITNVTLGHSPAPEPSTYALMGIGGLLIAFRLRKSIA